MFQLIRNIVGGIICLAIAAFLVAAVLTVMAFGSIVVFIGGILLIVGMVAFAISEWWQEGKTKPNDKTDTGA